MIETKNLLIRRPAAEDAERALMLFSDREAMRLVGMLPAYTTVDEARERLIRWAGDREEKRFSIIRKDTGEFVGYVAVNPDSEEDREDTRELGFAIAADSRRHGYAKEAVEAILAQLKKDGIKYVWACCFKENDASAGLIRSLGFELKNIGTYEPENDHEYESLEFRIEL